MSIAVEPVEKVPVLDFGGNVKKSDRVESSIIDDLMLGKGKVTPENSAKFVKKAF